ncbi:MAG: glutaminyl-peptide cyclotransferase [Fibrobacteraceae bacterium]|nr:glutaminyl-peptide cyclotransferase [Fibrobacteraceae bacterium]
MMASVVFAAALASFTVLDSVPHSTAHYTQGLFFDGKTLYETTGEYGNSGLFRYISPSNPAKDSVKLDSRYFGEGSIKIGDDIFWLTWREGIAFVYDARTLACKASFDIPGEGWGLSIWNGSLVLSDGSSNLFFLSPGDKHVFKTLPVLDGKNPVKNLNELEIVGNRVYANVWRSDSIAVIDIGSGKVLNWMDFSSIAKKVRAKNPAAEVLNGIAFDGKFFWITGKNWPVMYKVKF